MAGLCKTMLAIICLCVCLSAAFGDILWDTCEGIADHPSIKEGNYYNLCIQEHEFSEERHAWTFTRSSISDTVFDQCVFQNTNSATSNFTEASWSDVVFKDCRFGSFTDEAMVFDHMAMTNVKFDGCVFHNSVDMLFSEFIMNNVTFKDCRFESNTTFTLGEMNEVQFDDCEFKRSESATTVSGDDAIRFKQVTARNVNFKDSNVLTPLRFEDLNAADWSFNDTTVNKVWCHDEPDAEGLFKYSTAFNDTAFQAVEFVDNVYCSNTEWKGFFMGNVTFKRNADFSKSEVLDLYWDEVKMLSDSRESLTLDFSDSLIERRVLANTTIVGTATFKKTVFSTVYVKNFNATNPDFKDSVFKNQEFVDGHCCSRVCKPLKCICNVTEPSGVCPSGRRDVNVSGLVEACFPHSATVSRYDGLVVSMEELAIAERIAIGGGDHSDVFFFGHRDSDAISEFVSIEHSGSDVPLRISPNHYLYVDGKLRTAQSVQSGHRLRGADGKDSLDVLAVKREEHRGLYAPASLHGDLLVDGVVVSSYTSVVHPWLAHKLLHPLRLLYRIGLKSVVERVNFLDKSSYAHVPRALRIAEGPEIVDN